MCTPNLHFSTLHNNLMNITITITKITIITSITT